MNRLLNATFKSSLGLKGIISDNNLLFDPFDKAVSRIKYKPDLFQFSLQSEKISDVQKAPKSLTWAECCAERALSLLDMNYDQYWFAYSGGIDSTCMLSSILKFWPSSALSKISILLSHHSIDENPYFFNKYIVKFNLINSIRPISQKLLQGSKLMITGELGDQLFGSDILGSGCLRYGDSILKKSYKDLAPQIIEAFIGVEGPGKRLFEHFHPIVDEAPFPIRTSHDFFWWLNFTQKWQHVKFRAVEDKSWNLRARYGSHVLHFYDSIPFQKWSLQNHDLKIRNTWDSYKFPAKEFIADFTKDPGQLKLIKVRSLEKTYVLMEKRIAVTEDYREIHSYEDLKHYVR